MNTDRNYSSNSPSATSLIFVTNSAQLSAPDPLLAAINQEHRLAHSDSADTRQSARRCGELLLQKKASLPRGQWKPWLRAVIESGELDISQRLVRNYMAIASDPPQPDVAEDTARINGEIILMTGRSLRSGDGGIANAKAGLKLLIEPIEENGRVVYPWQYFRIVDSSGVTLFDATRDPPRTFREFIEAPLFKGLGEKLSDIERLIADDDEAVVRLRELIVAPKHLHKVKNDDADNVSIIPDLFTPAVPAKKKADAGNSRAYTLVRLKNERPDLFERVCAKELTANRAAIEAGWRKKDNPIDVAKRAIGKMDAAQRLEFFRWLANEGETSS